MSEMRMYSELAHWWPLLSPPTHYVAEATFFRALLWREKPRPCTLLEADGTTRVELDRHTEGVFPEATWLRLMNEAGLEARAVPDPWRGKIFLGTKTRG